MWFHNSIDVDTYEEGRVSRISNAEKLLFLVHDIDSPAATAFLSDGYPVDCCCACAAINKIQRAILQQNPKSFKTNLQGSIKT